MKIGDCMKHDVLSIPVIGTIRDAAQMMVAHHIGTLPVLDGSQRLVGLIRLRDLLSLGMPDFVRLLEHVDFVHDFGAVETHQPSSAQLDIPMDQVMGAPISVEETAGLLRAASILNEHQLIDLPVVDSANRLVGIASAVDIGTALLSKWDLESR